MNRFRKNMEIRDDIQTVGENGRKKIEKSEELENSEKVKQSPTRSLLDPLVFVISNGNIKIDTLVSQIVYLYLYLKFISFFH